MIWVKPSTEPTYTHTYTTTGTSEADAGLVVNLPEPPPTSSGHWQARLIEELQNTAGTPAVIAPPKPSLLAWLRTACRTVVSVISLDRKEALLTGCLLVAWALLQMGCLAPIHFHVHIAGEYHDGKAISEAFESRPGPHTEEVENGDRPAGPDGSGDGFFGGLDRQ